MPMSGFFAYPESSQPVTDAILRGVELAKADGLALLPWQKLKIFGFKIDNLIRDKIKEVDVLVADITYPNPNVFYEIGYAIAAGRPVIPTVNVGIERAVKRAQRTGLFDNIGWLAYANGDELATDLKDWPDHSWATKYVSRKNHAQPLFVLDTLIKSEFRNTIFSTVDNAKVEYRSFDPDQVPRLTSAQAVTDVSSSAGVIVPILSSEMVDCEDNNLRAAFIIGLAHGFGVEALAIQYGNGPAPLDYRDFITNSTFRKETESHVEKFSNEVLIWNQKASAPKERISDGLLSTINLGSPVAENENQSLGDYFVRTAEFSRALRAEGAVVVGRKGSGKTAVYFQVAEDHSRDRRRCVVDLRPASHNLSEMREAMLGVVSAGIFDHTIAAFWQYIIYMEVVLKLRELALPKSRNDFDLQDRIRQLEEEFFLDDTIVAGDFTSRLETAVQGVIRTVKSMDSAADVRSKLTNMMFERPIPRLRETIHDLSSSIDEIVLMIDDLDKGWPPLRVEKHDVSTIKHLIEVLNRIQRDLSRKDVRFRHLLFLRSDIYEKLVSETSDRGKYNIINVDWSDPEQLRHLLRERVINNVEKNRHDEAWEAINPKVSPNRDAVSHMIDSSLRRPRFLIDLCERTLSTAINRGHDVVELDDLNEGLRQMSLYLVSDFGFEMRDVAGTPEDIFYLFIGQSSPISEDSLRKLMSSNELGIGVDETIELLLWYGFLGIVSDAGEDVFIYDRAYDFRRLEAERNKLSGQASYAINPAFLKGLN